MTGIEYSEKDGRIMKVSDFKKYMRYGLGRCYLQLSACKNKQKYRGAVQYGCLHNLSYDLQSEGTRAEYVYALCSLFDDKEGFLPPVLEKFEKVSPAKDDFAHLCDLLFGFARGGNAEARAALGKKYAEIYGRLLKKKNFEKYDFDRDGLERIAVRLCSLDGLSAFLDVARGLGKLFLQNAHYDGWDFDWFYENFCLLNGKEQTEEILKRESLNSPEIKKFFECMKAEEERELAAKTARTDAAPKRFDGALNGGEDSADGTDVAAVDSLIEKLKKINAAGAGAVGEDDLHGVFLDILDLFDGGEELPKATLEFIYRNSFCSCCRASAVNEMAKRGWLSDEIKAELPYDSNEDIRSFGAE